MNTKLLTICVALVVVSSQWSHAEGPPMNPLTPDEARVILNKGTEAPYTGKYYDFHGAGTYICKQCNTPLYRSEDKFDSGCGWPSFDDEIPGAVKRQVDADGARTEILCARCGAHLGHVFLGERLTPKNTRHCVNSISMNFVPAETAPATPPQAPGPAVTAPPPPPPTAPAPETAIFAGGCFWGVEYYFQQAKGVLKTQVGYTGGSKANPTYQEVCGGNTGHIEAMEVTYDPAQTSYEDMARLFFEIHDPTQVNRQGPDIGWQYQSAVFYQNEAQKATAEKLIGLLKSKGLNVATKVLPAVTFWPAEDYHQQYYAKKGSSPYCHVYTRRF